MPVLGIILSMVMYKLLFSASGFDYVIILQALGALVVYYLLSFSVAKMSTFKLKLTNGEYDFSVKTCAKMGKDINLLGLLLIIAGISFSPDYLLSHYYISKLSYENKRVYVKRSLYLNILLTLILFAVGYFAKYLPYTIYKIVVILVFIRLISQFVQTAVDSVLSLYRTNIVGSLKKSDLVEYLLIKLFNFFMLFLFAYLIFAPTHVFALYYALRLFVLNPLYYAGIRAKVAYLMILQTIIGLVLIVSFIINMMFIAKNTNVDTDNQ